MKNKIYPCLWFNGNAREAADFYCTVFEDTIVKYENNFVVVIESAGQKFQFINAGLEYSINPSISFFVTYSAENEVNMAWEKLIDGGSSMMPLDSYKWSKRYGWVQDRYGVNWQLSYTEPPVVNQKFSPAMMFTGKQFGKAEQAINFYTSLFKDSGIKLISRYTKEDNDIEGKVNHAQFLLQNQVFMAMDSSHMHMFSFNEGVSIVVECDTQQEIDYLWEKLTENGEEVQCGWLKDKFGVSWQIIPSILEKLINDPAKSEKTIKAFMQMKKFDIEKLINA